MPEASLGMQRRDTGLRAVVVAERRVREFARIWLVGMLALTACVSPSRTELPNFGPFAPEHALPQGIATGDVRADSAVIWTRTKGEARVQVEWEPEGGVRKAVSRSPVVVTSASRDFTASFVLEGLAPATTYQYRALTGAVDTPGGLEPRAAGRFRTAAPANVPESVRVVWGGDLGGQDQCRRTDGGYTIFEPMRAIKPGFAILLGDLIYGDGLCASPPNMPGSNFVAVTLDGFRAKHRYQREDEALRRFLVDVPVYVMWDDHEVRNNFSGPSEPLMPIGRQALQEYWPIRTPPNDPYQLYRRIRHGADMELFILDTRQYRSSNDDPDGERKTMLGVAQRDWLIEGLLTSTATWKVIATSVPLSLPKQGTAKAPGNDSWARAADGSGFQTELRFILNAIRTRGVRNVVWLAADVHFAQVNVYDPDGDGATDFYEFIAGPLSARFGLARPPDQTFRPQTLYSAGGFVNFGVIEIDGKTLRLAIIDQAGSTRFARTFSAR